MNPELKGTYRTSIHSKLTPKWEEYDNYIQPFKKGRQYFFSVYNENEKYISDWYD